MFAPQTGRGDVSPAAGRTATENSRGESPALLRVRVRPVVSPGPRVACREVGSRTSRGGSTPRPESGSVTDGLPGSLLAIWSAPPNSPVADGAKVTARVSDPPGGRVSDPAGAWNSGALDDI